MKKLILLLPAVAAVALMIFGRPELALHIVLACAAAEVFSLFAPQMYFISAASQLLDDRRAPLWRTALLLTLLGAAAAVAIGVFLGVGNAAPAVYMALLMAAETLRQKPGKGGALLSAGLLKAFPEAFLMRGLYLVPAAALCVGAWYGLGVSTAPAYAVGLIAFSLLRVENRPSGAEVERFPVRWIAGGLLTALCAAAGFNGVFSAAYCAWGVIAALLPVRHGGKAWLCALLTLLQAAAGAAGAWFGMSMAAGAAALALWALIFLLQRRSVYAAWLPLRARMIRRRAK